MRIVALVLVLMPGAALAACPVDTLVSCDTGGGRHLEVCINPASMGGDGSFTYSFGPRGAPELQLSVPMAAFTVQPWSGFGRSIWGAVGFPNADYIYEVWHSFDRLDEDPHMDAGVNVLQNGSTIASLSCQPGGQIAPVFTLEDAMAAGGYCWNRDTFAWQRGDCG